MKIPNIYDVIRFLLHLEIVKQEYHNENYKISLKLAGMLIRELNLYWYVGSINSETLMYAQKSGFELMNGKKVK